MERKAEPLDKFIPIAEPSLGERELELVSRCVRSTWVSSIGEYIPQFEQGFARFCGARYGIATSNGTTALHLALEVLGIGAGDEVIVPTLTFVATANVVKYAGATPVFADSDPCTWQIDPHDVERKITPRTRAIIPVHLYGHPVDIDPLMALAERFKLWVIEDAAEAHGALYKGRPVGGLGHMGCFSFYGNKLITTGEGGMIVTNNSVWADKAASLRDHGMARDRRYWHPVIGYNYRLTNLQAALGVAQLERLDEFIALKRRNAALYNAGLRGVQGVTLPSEAPWAQSVYWMYSIVLAPDFPLGRDELMAWLKQRQIDSRPFFYPIHTMPPYANGESLPVAEDLADRGLNLPSAVTLSAEDIGRVCSAIAAAARC